MMRSTAFGLWVIFIGVPVFAGADNLLRNGGFEEPAPSGNPNEALFWKMGQPDDGGDAWGSASRESWRARTGNYLAAVRGLWAGAGFGGGAWQDVVATPGGRYRFSGWFYCDAEWTALRQEIKIEFWDADIQNVLGEAIAPVEDCHADWKEFSVEGVAPAGAACVRVVVNVENGGAMGSLQFDDLRLVVVGESK